MERRSFLKKSGQVGMAMSLQLPMSGFDFNSLDKLQIGVVADVHQDIIHDGYARL